MGKACAALLIKNGYRVFGVDKTGTDIFCGTEFFSADVTLDGDIAQVFDAVSALTDGLDAIVYAAGIYDMDSLIEISDERLRQIFDVNFFGACRVNRAFFPLLKKKGRMVIVTSELAPLDPLPFTGLYGITKTTLESYAFSLAMELQLKGISVSVIRPGAVETPLLKKSQERIEAFAEKTELYPGQAARFLSVTRAVESKSVPPEAVAKKLLKALSAKRPRFVYSLNRSPLLLVFSALPKKTQLFIIRKFLKGESSADTN